MDADGDMATDQSSTVMTKSPVRPDIVNFAQISNNSATDQSQCLDDDMATDQSSTVMTAPVVRPDIVHAKISNNSAAVSRRIPRGVGVANRIGKTRFAREMEEKLGKLNLTNNEKNPKEEENIASSSSSISAAKVEQGLDPKENQRKEDPAAYLAARRHRRVASPIRHPLADRQRREAAREWRKAAREANLQSLEALRQRRQRRAALFAANGLE